MALDKFRRIDMQINRANDYQIETQFAKEGDYNGRELVVQITNAGEVSDQTGVSLNLGWRHDSAGNTGLDPFAIVDASKGIFKITYPTEMLIGGDVTASIQVLESGKITLTRNFKITVENNPIDEGAIVSENSFTALTEALVKVNDLEGNYAPRLNEVTTQLAQTVTLDDGSDLQTLIDGAGVGATIKLKKNQLYTINKGLIPLEGQTIDLQNSTLKMSSTFDDTTTIENGGAPSLFTIKHKNIKIINGYLKGDATLTGNSGTNCGVLVTTDLVKEAENTIIENVHVTNVRGFGFLVYGGTKNTVIKNSTANGCFGLIGIEIWKDTMKAPRNVSIANVYGTNRHGIYVAGCDVLKIDNVNVNATQYNALFLYGGDAVGNLINCKVDSSYFKTTGTSTTFVMDGIVRTGQYLDEQMYVNAEISNSTFENTTSLIAEFKGKCRPKINNCDFNNGGIGILVTDCDKSFNMKNSKISSVRENCIRIRDKVTIEDCVLENANLALNDALGDIIYIYGSGSKSQIKNTRLGLVSGENGRYSINGETTVSKLTLHDLIFNDRNKDIALNSAVKSSCSIINCTNQTALTQPKMVLFNTIPTFGTWVKGDIVINSSVTTGGPMGWQCISSGSPGTWGALASVQ